MQTHRMDKQAAAFVPVYAAVRHRAPALVLLSHLQKTVLSYIFLLFLGVLCHNIKIQRCCHMYFLYICTYIYMFMCYNVIIY